VGRGDEWLPLTFPAHGTRCRGLNQCGAAPSHASLSLCKSEAAATIKLTSWLDFQSEAPVMCKHQRRNIKHSGCALGKAGQPARTEYIPLWRLREWVAGRAIRPDASHLSTRAYEVHSSSSANSKLRDEGQDDTRTPALTLCWCLDRDLKNHHVPCNNWSDFIQTHCHPFWPFFLMDTCFFTPAKVWLGTLVSSSLYLILLQFEIKSELLFCPFFSPLFKMWIMCQVIQEKKHSVPYTAVSTSP